jgi:hypothetical protein
MPSALEHLDQRISGSVVGQGTRVRHRQYGDANGDEGAGFVDFRHARILSLGPRHCLRMAGYRHLPDVDRKAEEGQTG